MLALLGIAAFLIGAAFFIGIAAVSYMSAKREYLEPFSAICPETHNPVEIRVNGERAAKTRMAGHEQIEISACTRWPERSDCDQACAPQVAFLGDTRTKGKYAPFALSPENLRINSPVSMTRELYDKIEAQLAATHKSA